MTARGTGTASTGDTTPSPTSSRRRTRLTTTPSAGSTRRSRTPATRTASSTPVRPASGRPAFAGRTCDRPPGAGTQRRGLLNQRKRSMSLQENIDQAGSPLALLTARSVDVSGVFPYPPVYTNWRDEQRAWDQTALLLDQSFHMSDLFISGPDVRRLLSHTSINSYRNLRAGSAKQYVAVNHDGYV